ncbi:GNAT family N-acetyltransferase [Vulgatibacter incomptus]|uniref:GNAT family N-acetyltransferase n=1 Tax=Vulgatibacter incomptus TaxID=1391653 RepID=UPI000A68677D|nr:N-acetyltransferase [Vulgatibacter incomptus]
MASRSRRNPAPVPGPSLLVTEVEAVEPAGGIEVPSAADPVPRLRAVPPEPEAPEESTAQEQSSAEVDAEAETGAPPAGRPSAGKAAQPASPEVRVRRLHRRDLNRTWEFLKLVFRDVNRETVEYQRPFSKRRFLEVYEEEGEQLLFEVEDKIVGYAECAFDASGSDNWVNPRYFDKRGMRPLYVDELAVHPDYQGQGVGGFMLDQLQHLARVRGCTHLVLEVAENNKSALSWYRKRNFFKLDAAIFMAQKLPAEPELLPPRRLPKRAAKAAAAPAPAKGSRKSSGRTRRK